MQAILRSHDPANTERTFPWMSRQPGFLIVDEMGLVLVLLKIEMVNRGCAVWVADTGGEGMELFKRYHEFIDMVLLDVEVPGLDGPKTLAGFRETDPGVRFCFMTGRCANYTREDLWSFDPEFVFEKPFAPDFFARTVLNLTCKAER